MKQTHCLRDKMFPRVVYIYCESFQSQGVKLIFFKELQIQSVFAQCTFYYSLVYSHQYRSVTGALLSRWMEAVKKGKVYENESQIIHTSTNKHKLAPIWLSPHVSLCVMSPFV
ncbi:hypothetical protein XENOCAPTIV_006371 [Xenoophorus captivus]|uniref:Uncharacterized protein n=1 Tax=Xenoophorus captivus TaxID=1517983 RepID=A0ABV0RFV1_9TELE